MAAENFRDAAADGDVEQIVYLAGLGDDAGGCALVTFGQPSRGRSSVGYGGGAAAGVAGGGRPRFWKREL